MPMRPMHLRTEFLIALEHAYNFDGPALIFRARVNEDQTRLVIVDDIHGVIDRVIERGCLTPPATFGSDEERHVYYRGVLARLELEWDVAELRRGNLARLIYRSPEDVVTPLCDWDTLRRFETVVERSWVLEPQTA